MGKEPLTIKYEESFYRYFHDPERGLYFGASLEAWKLLFKKYGYDFLCVDKNGVNAFFVMPNQFKKEIYNNKGLQFQYTKAYELKYDLSGDVLKKDLLNKFKNKFVNIVDLI